MSVHMLMDLYCTCSVKFVVCVCVWGGVSNFPTFHFGSQSYVVS